MSTITVWYNGNALSVYKVVAERLNLKHGDRIKSEKEYWDIIGEQCSHGMLISQQKLAPNN